MELLTKSTTWRWNTKHENDFNEKMEVITGLPSIVQAATERDRIMKTTPKRKKDWV